MEQYNLFIDGNWVESTSSARLEVDNPANETVIATIPEGTTEDASRALEAAQRAQPAWAALPATQRAAYIQELAKAVLAHKDKLARVVVAEQGKPLNQAEGEIEATAGFLTYAAEWARRIEGDIVPSDNPDEEVWIRRVPYGVVVGLTAWNYPSALVARKLGPALVTGNTFVLKGHEITPLSGLEIAKLASQVGLPDGVFNVVTGLGRVVGQTLVEHPLADRITMTGSVRAGKEIFAAAASELKILSLELGGKAPFIVMEDADLDKAVESAITARFTNCGQICTCNERMYLHEAIADEFLDKFIAKAKALTVADPLTNPDMGPKVSGLEVDKVADMVQTAKDTGAQVLLEGGRLTGGTYDKGHWYAPTVLEVSNNQNLIMQQEIFGPVVPVMRVTSFEDALQYANQSNYGLSAYVYTQNFRRIMRLTDELEFGELYINRSVGELLQGFHTGWKHSGLGGEDGKYGVDSYLRKKTMYVNWS
ncbi:MAG: aldehyde dehydrogenase [Deinococcota bacterium]